MDYGNVVIAFRVKMVNSVPLVLLWFISMIIAELIALRLSYFKRIHRQAAPETLSFQPLVSASMCLINPDFNRPGERFLPSFVNYPRIRLTSHDIKALATSWRQQVYP